MLKIAYGSALGVGSPSLEVGELEGFVSSEATGALLRLLRMGEKGEVGFMDLPYQDLSEAKGMASQVREHDPRWLLVIGIGGSSLGFEAALQALEPYLPGDAPRVEIVDNVDSERTAAVLKRVDLSRTVVNVVSKSGGTAESMANFMVVFDALVKRVGVEEAKRRVVFTTDPFKGTLRELAEEEGFSALDVPPNVGGRFSVLSPVGLFPLAVVGAPVEEILEGAAWMVTLCREKEGLENPTLLLAGLHELLNRKGRSIAVMMPYLNRLQGFTQWFCQLWAESLGKKGKGQTPLAALGANDQHSLVQLFNDGPKDKMVTFIRVEEPAARIQIPPAFSQKDSMAYLGGSFLHTLLLNEQVGTAAALTKSGVPNITISLERLNAFTLGALFMLYEVTTAVCGIAMGINPFDQPGVEQGKRFTYALMNRPGFEREFTQVKEWDRAHDAVLALRRCE